MPPNLLRNARFLPHVPSCSNGMSPPHSNVKPFRLAAKGPSKCFELRFCQDLPCSSCPSAMVAFYNQWVSMCDQEDHLLQSQSLAPGNVFA